jgi:fumarate hydratase subunit beta
MKKISAPLDMEQAASLKAGDEVLLSGIIYTARDQAHLRMAAAIVRGKRLPLELKGAVIYYCGPNPAPKGKVIGACGPTTSRRMDEFTPLLLKKGMAGMIGKGDRSPQVISAIKKYRGVYFAAYAGCGALIAGLVKKAGAVGYKDLGPEAVYELTVKDLPLIVAIDTRGRNIYD